MIENKLKLILEMCTPIYNAINTLSLGLSILMAIFKTIKSITEKGGLIKKNQFFKYKIIPFSIQNMREDGMVKFCLSCFGYMLEIYSLLFTTLLIITIAQYYVLGQRSRVAYCLVIMLFMLAILAAFIGRNKNLSYRLVLRCILLTVLGNIFFVSLWIIFPQYIIFIVFIECIYCFETIHIHVIKSYRIKSNVIIKWISNLLGIILIIIIFNNMQYNSISPQAQGELVLILWFALCSGYNIYAVWRNKSKNVQIEYKIYTTSGCEKIYKDVYQCVGNKIKYRLIDGGMKIADCEKIDYIEYSLCDFSKIKNNNVTCVLNNGQIWKFDEFRIIKNMWIAFYRLNGHEKQIYTMNIMKIKEISVKR